MHLTPEFACVFQGQIYSAKWSAMDPAAQMGALALLLSSSVTIDKLLTSLNLLLLISRVENKAINLQNCYEGGGWHFQELKHLLVLYHLIHLCLFICPPLWVLSFF